MRLVDKSDSVFSVGFTVILISVPLSCCHTSASLKEISRIFQLDAFPTNMAAAADGYPWWLPPVAAFCLLILVRNMVDGNAQSWNLEFFFKVGTKEHVLYKLGLHFFYFYFFSCAGGLITASKLCFIVPFLSFYFCVVFILLCICYSCWKDRLLSLAVSMFHFLKKQQKDLLYPVMYLSLYPSHLSLLLSYPLLSSSLLSVKMFLNIDINGTKRK